MADGSVVFDTKLDSSGVKDGLGKLKGFVGTMSKGMGLAIGAVATGLGALAKSAVSYNSQMEDYVTNFKVMLGSEEAAIAKVNELKKFAASTPFSMGDLSNATQTLLAFGVTSKKSGEVLKQMGDISLGNAEKMSRLTNVYGKVNTVGKLTGETLQQMREIGFDPAQYIIAQTGETMEEFNKRMASGKVGVDELDMALAAATGKGGQFKDGMLEASKTVSGMTSTLKDNATALVGETFGALSDSIGKSLLPQAIGYVDQLTETLRTKGVTGMVQAFGDILGDVVAKASTFAPQVIQIAVSVIKSLALGLKKNAKTIANGICDALKAAASGMLDVLPTLLSVALTIATELVGGLADAAPDLIPQLVDAIFATLTDLLCNLPRLLGMGVKIIGGIVMGMIRGVGSLFSGIGNLFDALFGGARTDSDATEKYVSDKCTKYATAYSDAKTEIDKLRQTVTEGVELTETDYGNAMTLLAEIKAMGDPTLLSGGALEQYKSMVQTLADTWPGMEKYIGEDGLLNAEIGQIEAYINALYRMKLTDLYADQVVAEMLAAQNLHKQMKERQLAYETEEENLAELIEKQQAWANIRDAGETMLLGSEDTVNNAQASAKQLYDMYIAAGGAAEALGNYDLDNLDFSSAMDMINKIMLLSDGQAFAFQPQIDQAQAAMEALKLGDDDLGIPSMDALNEQWTTATNNVDYYKDQLAALAKPTENLVQQQSGLAEALKDKGTKGAISKELGKADMKTLNSLMAEPPAADDVAGWAEWAYQMEQLCQKSATLKTQMDLLLPAAEETSDAIDGMDGAGTASDTGTDTKTAERVTKSKKSVVDDVTEANDAISTFGQDTGTLKDKATLVKEGIREGLQGDDLATAGSDMIDVIGDGMASNGRLKTILKTRTTSAVSGVKGSASSSGRSVGSSIVDGIVAGVSGKQASLNAAMAALITECIKAAKKAAGIASPSKLFRDQIGSFMAEGIGVGFDAEMQSGVIPGVASGIRAAISAAKTALDGTLLGQVYRMDGGANISSGALSAAILRGVPYASGRSNGDGASAAPANYQQTVNFYSTMQAPDEIARALRKQAAWGLAGAKG